MAQKNRFSACWRKVSGWKYKRICRINCVNLYTVSQSIKSLSECHIKSWKRVMCRNLFCTLKRNFSTPDKIRKQKETKTCVYSWVSLSLVSTSVFGVDFTVQVRIHANRSSPPAAAASWIFYRRQSRGATPTSFGRLPLLMHTLLRPWKYFMNARGVGSRKWNVWTAAASWRVCPCFSTPNNHFLKIVYA